MELEKGWCTMSRAEHWSRDNGRVIKCTHSGTESFDWQDHLDEKIMIARMGPQPVWLHKGWDNRTYHIMRHHSYRGHLTYEKEV